MMRNRRTLAYIISGTVLVGSSSAVGGDAIWGAICRSRPHDASAVQQALARIKTQVATPAVACGPAPTTYHRLLEAKGPGDLTVGLTVGSGADGNSLCYVYNSVPEAPVIRIHRGHKLTVKLTSTIQDTGPALNENCAVEDYVEGGNCTEPEDGFVAAPGANGSFYPIETNVPHLADGTTNLHVHGFVVSPNDCHDETIHSLVYPGNWGGAIDNLLPCQDRAKRADLQLLYPRRPSGRALLVPSAQPRPDPRRDDAGPVRRDRDRGCGRRPAARGGHRRRRLRHSRLPVRLCRGRGSRHDCFHGAAIASTDAQPPARRAARTGHAASRRR